MAPARPSARAKTRAPLPTPQSFFTISGYAPVAVQMELMRYWRTHGSPGAAGHAALRRRSRSRTAARKPSTSTAVTVQVERYTVRGLIWGMETLWMDSNNNLAALVSTDAEFDHFEAVREEYEPALAQVRRQRRARRNGCAHRDEQKLPGRRTGTFAFVGATVIDGTGKPPIPTRPLSPAMARSSPSGPARK